jgi:hypothetical protein
MRSAGFFILIYHLQTVFVDIFLIEQIHIFGAAVVAFQNLDMVVLDLMGFLYNALVRARYAFIKKPCPFIVRKRNAVQQFKLNTQIVYQRGFIMKMDILIALPG